MVFFGALASFLILFNSRINHPALADSSADAIAVRVIPNTGHLSALDWYNSQGFKGSPQALTVDGYNTIRDGRTVYVNAANVDLDNGHCSDNQSQTCVIANSGTCATGTCTPNLYTNIYLISYNQNPEQSTIDIFGQILSHWKFNVNLTALGVCSDDNSTKCSADSDCAPSGYCQPDPNNSGLVKALITRDTIRLERLAHINKIIENYKAKNNYYPKLNAGTYVTNYSISVWPSWQETLSSNLGVQLPTDPINQLGQCDANYDQTTCWDNINKKFATDLPILPDNSHAFVYTGSQDGHSYNLCAVMESGLITGLSNGACAGSQSINYAEKITNHAPIINCGGLVGLPGKLFSGYISATDTDGDNISWGDLKAVDPANFNDWVDSSFWVWGPMKTKLSVDSVPHFSNYLKISAPQSGAEGIYKFSIDAKDSRGKISAPQECVIKISQEIPIISFVPNQTVVIGKTLNFTINANEFSRKYPLSFNFVSNPLSFNCVVVNGHDCEINKTINNGGFIGAHEVFVKAADSLGVESNTAGFQVDVINHPPVIDQIDDFTMRWKENGITKTVTSSDPDGHNITFAVDNGLSIDSSGVITGFENLAPDQNHKITVTVTDQYGAVSNMFFHTKVNSYCGDGVVQATDGEGTNEQCEVAGNGSGPNNQYGCTDCQWTGGYCGDTSLENSKGEQCDGALGVYDSNVLGCNSDCKCQSPYSWSGSDCRNICSPFTLSPKWNWTSSAADPGPKFNQVMMTPMVADLNKDGTPEVIFTAFANSDDSGWIPPHRMGYLRVVNGKTGASETAIENLIDRYPIAADSQIAVGDINGDGYPDVVANENYGSPPNSSKYRAIAFSYDGRTLWEGPENVSCNYPLIADLDYDGQPEIICSSGYILNGADGTIKNTGGRDWLGPSGFTAVANIDEQGYPEVLNGCSAWHFDGTNFVTYWNNCATHSNGNAAVANIDKSTPQPEIVVVTGGVRKVVSGASIITNNDANTVALYDYHGNLIWQKEIPYRVGAGGGGCQSYYNPNPDPNNNRGTCHNYGGGPPTIADFNNDGENEIGVAAADYYAVFSKDGSVLWKHDNQDSSSAGTGSSVFDFENSGNSEVLYADEQNFYVFDGKTGAALSTISNNSGTLQEYPVTADINNDGQVEVVFAQNCYNGNTCAAGTSPGIRVFGNNSATCEFPSTRPIWNEHAYHITNVTDSGQIPKMEQNNWDIFNNWRQNSMDLTKAWCGNGVCDSGEDYDNCPTDCR